MAVDTRDKRASALNYQQPSFWLFPNPDGAIDTQADRQFVGHVYAVALEAVAVPAGFVCISSASIAVPEAAGTIAIPEASGQIRAC